MKKKILLICTFFIVLAVYTNAKEPDIFYYNSRLGSKQYLKSAGGGMIEFKAVATHRQKFDVLYSFGNDWNVMEQLLQAVDLDALHFLDINQSKMQMISNKDFVEYVNQVLVNEHNELQTPSNKVCVEIKQGYVLEEILKSLSIETINIKPLNRKIKNNYIITLKNGNNLASINVANRLYETGFFVYSEPNFYRTISKSCVYDEYFQEQWYLKNEGQSYGQNYGIEGIDIRFCCAHSKAKGNGIKVAVIDDGVYLEHPDLMDNLLINLGYDATDAYFGGANGSYGGAYNDIRADDHGTKCASVIAAVENDIGMIGVAPQSKIIPIRIFYTVAKNLFENVHMLANENYIISDERIADGINYAWDIAGADVLSCSWMRPNSSVITNSINAATSSGRNGKGCIVVFASGNDTANSNYDMTVKYPSYLDNVLSVGSIDAWGNRSSFSNFGTALNLVAPGERIVTATVPEVKGLNDLYELSGGTSFATPQVAGVAALILSVNPNLTSREVMNIMEKTARKVRSDRYDYKNTPGRPNGTWNIEMGYGLLDACAAVSMAMNIPDTIVIDMSLCYSIESNLYSWDTIKLEKTENVQEARWYLDYIANSYLKPDENGKSFFPLTSYINALSYIPNSTIVYCKVTDNKIYRYNISIVSNNDYLVAEKMLEAATNNKLQNGIVLSDDGKSGILFLANNSGRQRVNFSFLKCHYTIIELSSFANYTIYPNFSNTGNIRELDFQLKESVCKETIKLKVECGNCPEIFTLYLLNIDLLEPEEIIVTNNCTSGTILTVEGGNNCNGLWTKWRDPASNIIPNSDNLTSIEVNTAGTYKLEYYHPDDLEGKAIYIVYIVVKAEDIQQPILEILNATTGFDYWNNRHNGYVGDFCYFGAELKVNSISASNSQYKLFGSLGAKYDGNSDFVWSDMSRLFIFNDNKIYISEYIVCGLKEIKYKIFIEKDGENYCETEIPFHPCDCYSCEALESQFAAMRDAVIMGDMGPLIEQAYYIETKQSTNANGCSFSIRLPKNIEIIGIERDGNVPAVNVLTDTITEHNWGDYYEQDYEEERLFWNVNISSPCNLQRRKASDTFNIRYTNKNGDICERRQIFECLCPYNDKIPIWMLEVAHNYKDPFLTQLFVTALYVATPPPGVALGRGIMSEISMSPIYFETYDIFGNYLEEVYSSPFHFVGIQSSFDFSVANYTTGIYYLVLRVENEIVATALFNVAR